METPVTVSVIVPVYNVGPYLIPCVESILAQTYQPVEVVLIDDGSTDGSGELCDELAANNSIISVVHKQNAGLGYARNTGMDSLSGSSEYLMFVDSDDWLEKDAIEQLVEAMSEGPADCVIGGLTKKTASGDTRFTLKLENERYSSADEVRESLLPRLCGSSPSKHDSIPMAAYSTLYRREIVEAHHLRFPSERKMISEDFIFKFNFLLHSSHVVLCDFTGYCYRTVEGSLTQAYRPDRFAASILFFQNVEEMVRKENLPDSCLPRLDKSFFIYLRMCIKQERRSISRVAYFESRRRVESMVSNPFVRDTVDRYPISNLGIKQRCFLILVKHRQAMALLLLANLGLL